MNWWNDYIGIPYAEYGRARTPGLDCWGLVRLVHKERSNIDLPCLAAEYDMTDRDAVADLIAKKQEGWAKVDVQQSGDVVLFRVLGKISHIGLITIPGYFLHVREGQDSVIERLDSTTWKRRVAGIYRYKEGAALSVSAVPHPLKTQRIDAILPQGLNLVQIDDFLRAQAGLSVEYPKDAIIFVNGEKVEKADWELVWPLPSDRVEYRAVVRGGGIGKMIAMVVIAVVAWYAAPLIMGYGAGAAGWAAAGAAGVGAMASVSVASMAITMAGSLLVNAIFPVRAPSASSAVGPITKPILQGGSNQASKYSAIPVVLGRFKYTPPLGANSYVEAAGTKSYLRMLLVWGFGPLQISDIRIGDVPIDSYEEVEYETVSGYATDDLTRLNSLYGTDVVQVAPTVELQSFSASYSSAVRASNIVTVTTTAPHEFGYGSQVQLSAGIGGSVISASDYTFNFYHAGPDGPIYTTATGTRWVGSGENRERETYTYPVYTGTVLGSPWAESQVNSEVDRVTVSLYFQQGLFGMNSKGKQVATTCSVAVQVRPIGSVDWVEVAQQIYARNITLQPAWYNTDDDAELEPVYRWTRISINAKNQIIVRNGAFTTNPSFNPTGELLERLQSDNFGVNAVFSRLPELGEDEEELWQICVHGNAIHSTVDKRTDVTGCALSLSGLLVTIAAGTITRTQTESISITKSTRTSFSHNVNFYVPKGRYEIRARRTNAKGGDNYYDTCVLQTITGYTNERAVNPPKPLAMTAIRIKATNQIDGTADGVSGTVQAICPDWDASTSAWVTRPTKNPASLLRWVWQHPANAKALPDSKINLDEMADFHDYCSEMGWTYNAVLTEQKSLDEVARDIAAAGRASPAWRDGKRTVIIDRPRTQIAQHFTPHNSWGFESTKALPKMPHGWRVQFNNELRGWQEDERIVYADGYGASNATLFEGLTLPGVTHPDIVFRHARFHFAQLKLRPEKYTTNTDIENIISTRGDLVQTTHDVPMWGIGSGRIKSLVDNWTITLDESMPMEGGKQYTIRIRLENGSSITRTVAAKEVSGYFDQITVTEELTEPQAACGNLFMFGEMGSESAQLVVQAMEPSENMTARITLVDYSPAVYDSDKEVIPAFESKITKPSVAGIIVDVPKITGITSDETVMSRVSPGTYVYRIRVAFTIPSSLPDSALLIEGQIDFAEDDTDDWQSSIVAPVSDGAILFSDVQEGSLYRVRLRLRTPSGTRVGSWCAVQNHEVVGRAMPPSDIIDLSISGNTLNCTQTDEIDLAGCVFRFHYGNNLDWGTAVPLHTDYVTSFPWELPVKLSGVVTIMGKRVDTAENYSEKTANIFVNLGDAPVENVVETIDISGAGFVGDLENCSVVGGVLCADSTDSFYGSDSQSAYGLDNESFYDASTYSQMVFTTNEIALESALAGSNITLQFDYEGRDLHVEYRFSGPGSVYGSDSDSFYGGADSDSVYGPPGAWVGWPGMVAAKNDVYQWRVTIGAGFAQGRIPHFEIIIDAPDIVEYLEDIALDAVGTAIPYTKRFTKIHTITPSLQALASGAVTIDLDKTDNLHPIAFPKNAAGEGVGGATADFILKGR